jgi:hypothetical protein
MHFKCTIAIVIFGLDSRTRILSRGGQSLAGPCRGSKKGTLQAAGSLSLSGIKMERAMGIENNPMPGLCGFQGSCRIVAGFLSFFYAVA